MDGGRFFVKSRPCSEIGAHTPNFRFMLRFWLPYSEFPFHAPKLTAILRISVPCSEIGVHTPNFRSMLRNCQPYSEFPIHTPKLTAILRFSVPYSEIDVHTPIFRSILRIWHPYSDYAPTNSFRVLTCTSSVRKTTKKPGSRESGCRVLSMAAEGIEPPTLRV